MKSSWWLLMSVVAGSLLVGCLAQPGRSEQQGEQPPGSTKPKTLSIGALREPTTGVALGVQGDNGMQHTWVFQAGLTVYDAQGKLQPQIAQRVPSLESGDWKVLPGEEMEVTWKLRPDVRWHDGTPLSADDFVFGMRVAQDPEMPVEKLAGVRLITQTSAPDAATLVVRWSALYADANRGGPLDLPAVPRHLMADLYQRGDKQALTNSSYWTTEFVGLGPYRMTEWVLGSHTQAEAFDSYFLGRPKIDRLIIRYFTDANVLTSNVLAGEIDVVGVGSLKLDEILPIKNAWEPQGAGTVLRMDRELTLMFLQYRDPNLPWARDARVRQALVHLIDRQTLGDSLLYGLSSVADVLADRQDPVYGVAQQRGFARYPYDLTRAEGLLNDAGWRKGSDGVFQNGSERLSIEIRVQANTQGNVQEGLAAADQWKQGGLDVSFMSIPGNAANRNELKATNSGVFHTRDNVIPETLENFTFAQIPTERNGWRGRNFGGYNNPTYEQLHAQFTSALEPARRQELYVELLRLAAEDLPFVPLYYTPGSGTTVFRRGVTGPGPVPNVQPITAWNIHTWQMD